MAIDKNIKQMIQVILMNLKKYSFLFFSFLYVLGIQAQSKDGLKKIDTQAVSINSVKNILEEGEELNLRIIKFKKILIPSDLIIRLDSILDNDTIEIFSKRDSLLSQLGNATQRFLNVSKVEWVNQLVYLKENHNEISKRTEEVSSIKYELSNELLKWNLTKKILIESDESSNNQESLNKIIGDLEEITLTAQSRLDNLFIIQKKMIELILTVDKIIYEIEEAELQLQKNYFVFDTYPIWKSKTSDIDDNGKIKKSSGNVVKLISSSFKNNKRLLLEFLSLNIKSVISQLFFILILLILVIKMKNKWKSDMRVLTNPFEIQDKIILSHPLSTAIIIGLLFSNFFYQAMIPVFVELIVSFLLIITVFLLPKLTIKRFQFILLLIFSAYLIYILETYLNSKLVLSRILMILEAIILTFAIISGKRIIKTFSEQFITIYKLFNFISPLYILILLTSILANLIGMMNLSRFLIKGILISTILGVIVFLGIKALTSLIVLFYKLQKTYKFKTLSNKISITHHRILPILNLIGVIVWLLFTLKGFDVFDLIIKWINELMLVQWVIGEATISLGGLLSFLIIFIITLILSKITSTLFQDDWMINLFPRGVAIAISLMLRIIFISIGFSLALFAAGFDLTKLGFIIGALGVGIGFGLQNVVLNFIAGLILAFERPINLGDTIVVDDEFGIVTHIGVRASNIKSYTGYEVIIPNGDLISKKVINYTLNNRDRRSKILMKTSPNASPEKVIALFNKIASGHPKTFSNPAPNTFFYGYNEDGNLNFALIYWSTFSDTLEVDHEIALEIFAFLKKEGIEAPTPTIRIISKD